MAPLINPDGTTGTPGQPAPADLIQDSNTQQFAQDVIEASKTIPVIVDFWAPWCGPCKTLGPLLEKLVLQAGGLVKLVKINVDENQQLAQQLRVQSVPMVYGFRDGRAVDGFMGAQPESNIRVFIDRLTGGAQSPLDEALAHAESVLESGDAAEASAVYNEILAAEPGHPAALAGLIRCLTAVGDLEQARAMADALTPEAQKQKEVVAALSALDLAEQGQSAGDLGALSERVNANPDDHDARFELANALYASQNAEDAVGHLLEIVKRDRAWNDDAARKQLVSIFEALGPTHPLTSASRRKLSSLLFS